MKFSDLQLFAALAMGAAAGSPAHLRAGSRTHLAFGLEFCPVGAVGMVRRAPTAAGRSTRLRSSFWLQPDTWQEVVITAGFAAGRFDLSVAGLTEYGLSAVSAEGYHRLNTLGFAPAESATALHLRNVKVVVFP
jgi:hypothetical protein